MIHWFDIFVTVFLLASALYSYVRGFVRDLFSILSLVAGYIVASMYYDSVSAYLTSPSKDKLFPEAAAFIMLFAGASALVVVAGIYARKIFHVSEALGAADRILGAGLGLVKGVLALAIVIYPLVGISGVEEDFSSRSKSGPALVLAGGGLIERFAPGLAKRIERASGKLAKLRRESGDLAYYEKKIKAAGKLATSKARDIGKRLGLGGAKKEAQKPGSGDAGATGKEVTEPDRNQLDNLLEKID